METNPAHWIWYKFEVLALYVSTSNYWTFTTACIWYHHDFKMWTTFVSHYSHTDSFSISFSLYFVPSCHNLCTLWLFFSPINCYFGLSQQLWFIYVYRFKRFDSLSHKVQHKANPIRAEKLSGHYGRGLECSPSGKTVSEVRKQKSKRKNQIVKETMHVTSKSNFSYMYKPLLE